MEGRNRTRTTRKEMGCLVLAGKSTRRNPNSLRSLRKRVSARMRLLGGSGTSAEPSPKTLSIGTRRVALPREMHHLLRKYARILKKVVIAE